MKKHGKYASWAFSVEAAGKPKSNMGDMEVSHYSYLQGGVVKVKAHH
jgi:hypothetical protein